MTEKYDIISNYPYLCGEAPIWDSDNNVLFWSDMLAGFIYKYNPLDNSVKQISRGKNVSGMSLRKQGGLICACHQGVYFWTEKDGYQLIARKYKGNILRSNDAISDAMGRFLFGTTFYGPGMAKYPLGKLYKIENDGAISILEEGVHLSNGLGFSLDNKILYYTDTVLRTIYAYEYNLKNGTISNRRVFVKVPESDGIPDGMTVDSEGFLWSALWYGSCIIRYDPEGKVHMRINTPAKQTSSLIFGGKDLTDIFVTTSEKSVKLHVAPKGYDFNAPDTGGPLYRYNLGIKGKPDYKADIDIKKT